MSFYNESVSVSYHHGSRIILTPAWHDKNIICPNSKLYYVLRGEICVEAEGKKLIAREGDAMLIPSGIKHSYHLTELGFAEKYWFHFDLRIAQSNYFDCIDIPRIKHLGTSASISALFRAVIGANMQRPQDKLTSSSALLSLLAIYIGGAEYIEAPSEPPDETDKVISYIKKNYHESFTLEGLADMANLSPNYLLKKFRERTGLPPHKYINELRLERAKFLLEHTEKSVNSIMEEVGFWDSAHFSKLFKAKTGYAPSKFRRVLKS